MLRVTLRIMLILNNINILNDIDVYTFVLRNRLLRRAYLHCLKLTDRTMKNRRSSNNSNMLSKYVNQLENVLSMMASEKPLERIQSLESKINEVDKIHTIEKYVVQLKEYIWTVKEVLTTAEASAYLGVSESYIYKLTSTKQIPHYKPNGRLVYFNRKELCEWAMRNQIRPAGQITNPQSEAL